MTETSDVPARLFRSRAAALVAFAVPLAYAGHLSAVLVHEVGHGVAALAAGGRFFSLRVALDGAGSVEAHADSAFPFAAGTLACLALGLPLLALGAWRQPNPLVRLAATVFAALLLSDTAYAFWGAVSGAGLSDMGRVLEELANPWARWGIVGASGAAYFATVVLTTRFLLRAVEDAAGPLSRERAVLTAALLTAAACALWLPVDWAPFGSLRLGRVPAALGIVLQGAVAFGLALRWRPQERRVPLSRRAWALAIASAWAFAAIVVLVVAGWTQKGIRLGP